MKKKKGKFTIVEEDPTIYPHTCFHPMIHMGTVFVKWAMQYFPWVNMHSTIDIIEVFNLLNKYSCCHIFMAEPS
jgi:hypothetical protein